MSLKKWLIVGISGATCSGKTTLANQIHNELRNSVVIHQDDYFLPADDARHVYIPEINHLNWELETSMDMDKMRSDILNLIKPSPTEAETNEQNVLLIEGFRLFKCKVISNLCDKKYFITLTKEECWERRKGRTYDPPDVPGYFDNVVWPEYLMHKEELTKDTDLCGTVTFIDGSKSKQLSQTVLTEIKKLLT
ncbi:nicotinamide riboside kinase [Andrena cerasifolii]|uniref:nicotinamide riboside kinase n=1 Tax=Andrena cerasifolii TaxID=2819439 RepID=UPI004038102E